VVSQNFNFGAFYYLDGSEGWYKRNYGIVILGGKKRKSDATIINDNNCARMDDIYFRIEAEIPRLRRFARYLTRNIDDADDLVQDCLVRAMTNMEKWQRGTNLRAWLFVILRNIYINDRRRAKRWTYASDTPLDYFGHAVPGNQESRQELFELQKAFTKLSEEHKEILFLVAIDGFAYEEAGEILAIPIGTVRSRLSRARATLKELADGTKTVKTEIDPDGGTSVPAA
jgi:RNA polymerase sigma-70 factor (ECF subfamily)